MSKKDYYEVLGINKDADVNIIKKTYRKLALQYHPDTNPDNPEAEAQFKEINEAYEVLSDPKRRKDYDTYGHNGPQASSMDDIMSHFAQQFGWGNTRQKPNRGNDLRINVYLTLEEIYTGITKKLKYKKMSSCKPCKGNGGDGKIQCSLCKGNGQVMQTMETAFGHMMQTSICPTCSGSGNVFESKCKICHGHGLSENEEIVDVEIPYGIKHGEIMAKDGGGHEVNNGIAGRLLIVINEIQHSKYTRINHDLRMKLQVKYHDLVLGSKIDVETIDGSKIRVTVPEYSNVNDTLRIKGKGMQAMYSTNRGDMLLELTVDIPSEISDEERDLLEKLKNLH